MPRCSTLLFCACSFGCADPEPSRFQATSAVCAFTPRPWDGISYHYRHLDEVYADEACVDRVLADFEVDVDAFLEADALEDPYGAVRDDEGAWDTRLGGLLSAAWALHAFDWGPTDALREGPAVDAAYVARVREIADETGGTGLGEVLYDYVTAGLVETLPGEGDTYAATWSGGTLTLFLPLSGPIGAASLVHEARHGDGAHHHRRCASGERACDADLEGAYGFQAATVASILPRVGDPSVADHLAAHLENVLEHVE